MEAHLWGRRPHRQRGQGDDLCRPDGYIPPEGPGTPSGDVYSLGKVLYECSMGRDRLQYPDLPTTMLRGDAPHLRQLNEIILRACESNPDVRYQTADQLHADLILLQRSLDTLAK